MARIIGVWRMQQRWRICSIGQWRENGAAYVATSASWRKGIKSTK